MPERINTAQLDDGILSADATGRAKVAAGFFGSGDPTTAAMFGDGSLPSLSLINGVIEGSRPGVGYVRFAANVDPVSVDTISIGAPAEVWTVAAGAPATDWEYTVGLDAAASATSFAARVNANAGSAVRALVGAGGTEVVLFPKLVATGDLALAESTSEARTVVSAAAMTGSHAAAGRTFHVGSYTVTAADVTTMAPGGAAGEVPVAVFGTALPILGPVTVLTSTGAFRTWGAGLSYPGFRLLQQGANEFVLLMKEAGAAGSLSADDTVRFCVVY